MGYKISVRSILTPFAGPRRTADDSLENIFPTKHAVNEPAWVFIQWLQQYHAATLGNDHRYVPYDQPLPALANPQPHLNFREVAALLSIYSGWSKSTAHVTWC